MAWVRSDDNEPNHPKIFRAGVAGYGFFQAAKCYCSRNLTDGFIPVGDLSLILPGVSFRAAVKLCIRLVECGLFEKEDTGYRVHDYLHYNPSKDQVLERRSERAEAGRSGGLAKALAVARREPEVELRTPACPGPARPGPALPDPTPKKLPRQESAGFARFWAVFPKRVGRDEAFRAWMRKGCEGVTDEILTALAKHSAYLLREGGKFVPNPATWLSQGRWKDEPPAVTGNALSDKGARNVDAAKAWLEEGQ